MGSTARRSAGLLTAVAVAIAASAATAPSSSGAVGTVGAGASLERHSAARAVPASRAALTGVPQHTTTIPVGVRAMFWPYCGFNAGNAPEAQPILLEQRVGLRWVVRARGRMDPSGNPGCEMGVILRWTPPKVGDLSMRFRYLPAGGMATAGVSDPFTVHVVAAPPRPVGQVAAWGDPALQLPGGGLWPAAAPALATAVSVTSRDGSWYAVMKDGSVLSWGNNAYGQLGDGTTTARRAPRRVKGLTGVTAVTTSSRGFGSVSVYAVLADGTVRAWGANGDGQLGDGSHVNRAVPVPVLGLTSVVKVSAACSTAFAVRSDGTVASWGLGEGVSLGDSSKGRATPQSIPGLAGVTDVVSTPAADYCTTSAFAVLSDGTVRSWGFGISGELGTAATDVQPTPTPIPGLDRVVRLVAVPTVSPDPSWPDLGATVYALRDDGTVFVWGDNGSGQVGDGSTSTRGTPVAVSGLGRVVSLTAFLGTAWAVLSDGSVWGWGANRNGEIGDGTTVNRPRPVRVPRLQSVAFVAAGAQMQEVDMGAFRGGVLQTMYAVTTTGEVWAWGDNAWGQTGSPRFGHQVRPARVAGTGPVRALAVGDRGVVALPAEP